MLPLGTQYSIPEDLETEERENNNAGKVECLEMNNSNPALESKLSNITCAETIESIDPANAAVNCPLIAPSLGETNIHNQSFQHSLIPGWKTLASLEPREEENLVRRSATIDNSTIRPLLRYTSTVNGRVSIYNNHMTSSLP